MNIDTLIYSDKWKPQNTNILDKDNASLVVVFGESDIIKTEAVFSGLKSLYPQADIIGASSAGNILGNEIHQAPVIATAVEFEKGTVSTASIDFLPGDDIEEVSHQLISQLPRDGLSHIFLLSDGLNVNGSALVRGVNKLAADIPVTGGMAGDGERFQETWILANAPAKQFRLAAIGFYGDDFVISTGCFAGWSEFGGDRLITRSSGNVLYEIDNEPALELYKKYLGHYADGLPESGMRFPLSIKHKEDDPEVIRTLLAINEDNNSITFAGDVPEGYTARLMKPEVDLLIDGAKKAAEDINKVNENQALGLVVSCAGRRTVMKDLIEEELEILEDVLGQNIQLTGLYSYGELAPFSEDVYTCELHNQTMTLTAIFEK
ncbi:MAG: FIST C-terminal domain-containing protein [Gammaproteobacteria bacterium]|nr:FIST C-terminal domain-containing protein [Gammaproteobacteria bacterium]